MISLIHNIFYYSIAPHKPPPNIHTLCRPWYLRSMEEGSALKDTPPPFALAQDCPCTYSMYHSLCLYSPDPYWGIIPLFRFPLVIPEEGGYNYWCIPLRTKGKILIFTLLPFLTTHTRKGLPYQIIFLPYKLSIKSTIKILYLDPNPFRQ